MCFSPQWRAIFRHLNFQKWSKHAVFCTFWLANVLFATAACNFWFLLWAPTSAPAALTGLLFDWPDTRIIEKTQHFATSLTFGTDVSSFFWLSRYCIFCRLTWWLYCWAMHLLFNCPYCRKFLFKLPSMRRQLFPMHHHASLPGPWLTKVFRIDFLHFFALDSFDFATKCLPLRPVCRSWSWRVCSDLSMTWPKDTQGLRFLRAEKNEKLQI